MVTYPSSMPRKLLPATLKDATRRAARTGGPSSTSGSVIAMARILLNAINDKNPFSVDCTLAVGSPPRSTPTMTWQYAISCQAAIDVMPLPELD